MTIGKTYTFQYRPFHYSEEVMVFTGTVERFTYPPFGGSDGVLINDGKQYHTLTLHKIISYS
jgi:hypothetical protein